MASPKVNPRQIAGTKEHGHGVLPSLCRVDYAHELGEIELTESALLVTDMADKSQDKPPLVVDADAFDSVLKRLIEHKPVPKKSIATSRKTKRGKILSK